MLRLPFYPIQAHSHLIRILTFSKDMCEQHHYPTNVNIEEKLVKED